MWATTPPITGSNDTVGPCLGTMDAFGLVVSTSKYGSRRVAGGTSHCWVAGSHPVISAGIVGNPCASAGDRSRPKALNPNIDALTRVAFIVETFRSVGWAVAAA